MENGNTDLNQRKLQMELTVQKLDTVERGEWRKQRAIVAKHKENVWEWIEAIRIIRDKKLYREDYKTFELYADSECGLSRQYVNRMIEAAGVRVDLETIVSKSPRANEINTEGQLKELKDVPRDELELVVNKAAEIAGDAPITAKIIREAKAEVLEYEDVEEREPGCDDETPEETEMYGKKITLQIMDNTKYHREIHACVCEALRQLAAVPEVPGTEMLIARTLVIKRELDHAKASIMATKPYAICPRCKGAGCPQCGNLGWVNSALAKELAS